MNPGQLKFKIDIEKEIIDNDEYGAPTKTWVPFLSGISCSHPISSGNKFFAMKQNNTELTHIFKIRYRNGIEQNMRVKFSNNKYFRIISAIHVKQGYREIELHCAEVFPNG